MAARVEMASGEVGQAGGAGVKPAPGPNPRLIPKPFSLQRNTTLRSILAPKTLTTTPQPSQTTPTTPTTSSKPGPNQPISAPVSDSSSAVKLDAESTMIPEPTNALKAPSAITPHTDSTHTTKQNQAALSTSSSLTAPTSEPPASTISDPTGTSEANQSEDTVSEPTSAVVRHQAGEDQAAHWGGGRKRLSMELTSRVELAGRSLPSQPPAKDNKQNQEQATKRETAVLKVSVLRTKEEEKIPDSPGTPFDPECRLKHSATLKEERDGEGVKEEGEEKVSCIQRRISLLLDYSSRPEALTKREEVPGPIKQADGSGGVKQRIKDWALDTPPVQASNQRVDVAPQPIPIRVYPALGVTGGSLATSESVQLAPQEDKAYTLCRSGHSGIKVNREEIEDEEEEGEEEEGEEKRAQVALYKPVGRLLRMKDGGKKQELVIDQIEKDMETKVQEEEKVKQLELEERQAVKEREKEKERERQREEKERKTKEEGRERQREIERERDRQRQREEEERERKRKEEERERDRQIQLEREKEILRKEEERERRKEEERETERQIEVKRERVRQREEEERERIRVEEGRLREKEMDKLIEEERERERKREEERMKEDERQREEGRARERQREEESEKEESPVQLITLEPDQPPKPEPPSRSPTIPIIEPIPKDEEQPHINVVYNFSIKEEKPLIEVVYDNFSVKLGREPFNAQEPLRVKPHQAEGDIEWGVPTPDKGMEKEDEKVDAEENVDTEELGLTLWTSRNNKLFI
ncbi:unnamed protein product [Coregonus sp. 'balchen']|nr:unnamed protein product [Coregonus sp. 'balchen']